MANVRKRIALFVGQADESYQERFIVGFMKNAFAADFDVCIFSMYRKYQDTAEREQGESNIFSLMNPDLFDGAVILKDSIQTAGAAETLENRLKQTFSKPIVAIEKESDLFPSICTDGYAAVYEIVSHLIEVHGCRDIAFLTGKKWHKHSKERCNAYRAAMQDHGLSVPADRIIYGDFWYQSGEMLAEQMLSKGIGLPDAVACANDQMAIGLCKALNERGIRVPEDIAVAGYDSTFEGRTSPKTLTSAMIPAEEFGEYAFEFLMARMLGKVPDSFKIKPHLLIGESCGCTETTMPEYRIKRDVWGTDISEEGYLSVFTTMHENLILQSSLTEYLSTVYSYAYQISGAADFHLCLANSWKYMEQGIHVKNNGYPEQMIHAIRYQNDHRNNMVGLDQLFQTAEMLPELSEPREQPSAYIFTPVFSENECYGYAVIHYEGEPRCYDEIYRRWILTVSCGFEVLRRNILLKQMQKKLEKIRNNKFAVAHYAYETLTPEEREEYDLVRRILDENLLDYHFQPIIRASDGTVCAYEALMRPRTKQRLSPLAVIKYANMQDRLPDIERATFLNVLRLIERKPECFAGKRVFLNSIPGVRIAEESHEAVQAYLQKYANRIVVELTEEAELSDEDLCRLKNHFNRLGIDIAVDDYGMGYSNVSNLLRYMPNVVKIDRSLITDIQNQPQKLHFVREIIEFCHDSHITALAEGVETAEELRTVIHLGVDLIQGFYTAKPSPETVAQISETIRSEIRQYHQERLDGSIHKLYIAGKTNRISLSKLVKDGCTDIIVGKDGMVYKDISVIGTPGAKTDIHLRVEPEYCGRITLEDACFANVKNRPCIELGERSDVTLALLGENVLLNTGILVPESARLTIEGNGSLRIELNTLESFGIGNHHSARHGELIFEQDGAVQIHCRGKRSICIGSGLGGTIRIHSGEFDLKSKSTSCVGIGALTGDVMIDDITNCHIEAECSVTEGVLIGSFDGSAEITLNKSAVNFYGDGKTLIGFGTVRGRESSVSISDCGLDLNIRADNSTCLGALHGKTAISSNYTSLKLENAGINALALGGYDTDTVIRITNSDTNVNLRCSLGKDTFAPEENIRFINGRQRFLLNGYEIQHNFTFDYES